MFMPNLNSIAMNSLRADTETPRPLARRLIRLVSWSDGDRFYEPFRGNGAFYDAMPEPKDWAEISLGRDFFKYKPFDGTCEHIISNPPFRTVINGRLSNAYISILERCMTIATKSIALLISHKIFNSLTPIRLEKYKRQGWVITKIHVVNVKKWFGRYYFIIFERGYKSIISWDIRNW